MQLDGQEQALIDINPEVRLLVGHDHLFRSCLHDLRDPADSTREVQKQTWTVWGPLVT
jgi:hypothetical protein